jgi:hypothetical protein
MIFQGMDSFFQADKNGTADSLSALALAAKKMGAQKWLSWANLNFMRAGGSKVGF